MATDVRRYSLEEMARRGHELIETKVRPNLTEADRNKIVAIDVQTGEYELDKNEMRAVKRLRKRLADPQIWLSNVTTGYLRKFGARGVRGKQ